MKREDASICPSFSCEKDVPSTYQGSIKKAHWRVRGTSPARIEVETSEPEPGTLGNKKKIGFIDTTGKVVIEPRFDGAQNFSDGMARITVGGKFGFIDRSGKLTVEPRCALAWDFSEGLAPVQIDDKWAT